MANYHGDGKEVWKELEKITAYGYDRSKVFSDWLDLMVSAVLSQTLVVLHGKAENKHEKEYLAIVGRYKQGDKEKCTRPIDYFSKALGLLILKTLQTRKDILGEIYENYISLGERGQFFTPENLVEFMAKIAGTDRKNVADPACGSGRLLLAAAKENPGAELFGADLDPRCAKMTALNLWMFGFCGEVWQGDTLSMNFQKVWRVRDGLMVELEPKQTKTEERQPALFNSN